MARVSAGGCAPPTWSPPSGARFWEGMWPLEAAKPNQLGKKQMKNGDVMGYEWG